MTAYIPVEIKYIFKLERTINMGEENNSSNVLKGSEEQKKVVPSPLKIGSGTGKNSSVDNTFKTRKLANSQKVYEIPGTSVKGHFRSTFKKLEHLFDVPAEPIFGEERYAGWAHFSPLRAKTESVHLEWSASTSVDRFRKAAKNHSLRVEEFITLKEGSFLAGEVDGYIPDETNKKEVFALMLAMLATKRFGGDKSTGYGMGRIIIESCKIGDWVLKQSEIEEEILKHLGEGV
ncbi:RAMP superfamily CRISPR-associated protein [Ureibacillus terrenus]|nr:RAMP superfamily CRISPR-associated protein [Ureibacillus terrenus]